MSAPDRPDGTAGAGAGTWPVFLIGAPRSGTSLLYKCLALHPDAVYISNYVERAPRLPVLAALNRVPPRVPKLQQRVWFGDDGNAYVYNSARALRHKLVPMPTEGESLFGRLGIPERPTPPDAPVALQAVGLRRTFEQVRRWGGGSHVVCKRIANNLRIPLLAGAFPDARFVVLTRDGRAVASSLRQVNWWPDFWLYWWGGTTTDWEAAGHDPWEAAARLWVEELRQIDDGLQPVPAPLVHHVSYENFVSDPLGQLVDIGAFCGLEPVPSWLERLEQQSFPDNNERWRSKLDAAAIATVERIQHDELVRHGYLPG